MKKGLRKGYYSNEGLGLAWELKAHFLDVFLSVPNFMIFKGQEI